MNQSPSPKLIVVYHSIFLKIDFAFSVVSGTIIGEPGDADFTNAMDSELEGITLPHAGPIFKMKPFSCGLWFGFDSNEKPMCPENTMNRSPGTREFDLNLIRRAPHAGYFPLWRMIHCSNDAGIALQDLHQGPVFFSFKPVSGSSR